MHIPEVIQVGRGLSVIVAGVDEWERESFEFVSFDTEIRAKPFASRSNQQVQDPEADVEDDFT